MNKRFALGFISSVLLLLISQRFLAFFLLVSDFIEGDSVSGTLFKYGFEAIYIVFLTVIFLEYFIGGRFEKTVHVIKIIVSVIFLSLISYHIYILTTMTNVNKNNIIKTLLLEMIIPFILISITGLFKNKAVRIIGFSLCVISIAAQMVYYVREAYAFFLNIALPYSVALFFFSLFALRTDVNVKGSPNLGIFPLLISCAYVINQIKEVLFNLLLFKDSDKYLLLKFGLLLLPLLFPALIAFLCIQLYYKLFTGTSKVRTVTLVFVPILSVVNFLMYVISYMIFTKESNEANSIDPVMAMSCFLATIALTLFVFQLLTNRNDKLVRYTSLVIIGFACIINVAGFIFTIRTFILSSVVYYALIFLTVLYGYRVSGNDTSAEVTDGSTVAEISVM